jgi:hypothetical protein
MALEIGTPDCTTGLAARIFTRWQTYRYPCGFVWLDPLRGTPLDLTPAQIGMLKNQAFHLASAIVEEITTNGRAVVETTTAGLQRLPDPADPFAPTLAPAVAVRLVLE